MIVKPDSLRALQTTHNMVNVRLFDDHLLKKKINFKNEIKKFGKRGVDDYRKILKTGRGLKDKRARGILNKRPNPPAISIRL